MADAVRTTAPEMVISAVLASLTCRFVTVRTSSLLLSEAEPLSAVQVAGLPSRS